MSNVSVEVRALAYEKGHVKKKLSEFDNDLGALTPEQLATAVSSMKDWVRAYVSQYAGAGTSYIVGGDVTMIGSANIRNHLFGGDIAEIQ